jgi:dTDP-glucose 4,6-dehydratase
MRSRWDGVIDEDHPTRPGSLYGAYKAAIEAHMWSAHFSDGLHACAVRPCAVYGIDPRLERSIGYPIVDHLRRKQRFSKPGGGKFVHVDDVAALTTACVGNTEANGRVFNMADCYARWGDLAVIAADLLGIDADIDLSSPPQSKNRFTKDAVQSLGVSMDRGHDGLREYLRDLIDAVQDT